MKSIFSPLFLFLFLGLASAQAQSNVPWSPLLECSGPAGNAVLDAFSFSTHGRMVYLQQLVIRTREINEYLASKNLLAGEVAKNYPNETVIPLMRSTQEYTEVPTLLSTDIENLTYKVDVQLPEIRLSVYSRITRGEIGNWIFRNCRKK